MPRKDAEAAGGRSWRRRAPRPWPRGAREQLSMLRSPITGVVTRMTATLGASVDASQPLVEIADPSALDVLLSVTPTDAARVRPGAQVTLSAGQARGGEPLGIGTVVDVAGTVDSATRSVADPRAGARRRGAPLRIGETVFGAIAVGDAPERDRRSRSRRSFPRRRTSRCSSSTRRASRTSAT